MEKAYFERVTKKTPTRFWVNNVTREQARLGIENGAVGCTQNPTFVWKVISKTEDSGYAVALLDQILKTEKEDRAALAILQAELVKNICKEFEPMFIKTCGRQGWVSIQADPFRENETDILYYSRLHRSYAPNVICKIPATKAGLQAMKTLCREGVPILATEVMSVQQAVDVMDIYEEATAGMEKFPVMFMAHIAGIFDEHLQVTVENEGIDVDRDALWQAGIIVAKKIAQILKERRSGVQLLSGGARGLHHFTEMVGAKADVTINWDGTADKLLEQDPVVIDRFNCPASATIIEELLQKVPDFRRAYLLGGLQPEAYESFGPVVRFRNSFEKGWKSALQYTAERRALLNGEKA